MIELELTKEDKIALKKHIKLHVSLIILFYSAVILLIGIVSLLFLVFQKPAKGLLNRGMLIVFFLFIPFIGVIWKVIKIYIDLKSGKKLLYEIEKFEIIKEKKSIVLIDKKTQDKFKIEEYLLPYINVENPIKIEITKLSKEILFISNDAENYIYKADLDNVKS
jgi:uncharacterized membrane protein YqjE